MDFPPPQIQQLVTRIAQVLRSRNQTLAVSEAACGGLISACIVSVPGASNFYIGGKLVYSLKQRLKLSGLSDDEIRNYTGPSEQVALKLARTTKYELGSTYVLSETGFAGPTGLVDSHAGVGTVFLGLSGPKAEASARYTTDKQARAENMVEFARLGLEFLLQHLEAND